MPFRNCSKSNRSSIKGSKTSEDDEEIIQGSPPKTHSLVKAAFGSKHYMNPEDLLLEEQAKQLIKEKFEKAALKVIKAKDPKAKPKDPRIKQILYLRDFEEREFAEIGTLLFPELPPQKAEQLVKNKYYHYQRKIEESMAKDRELKELFKTMR